MPETQINPEVGLKLEEITNLSNEELIRILKEQYLAKLDHDMVPVEHPEFAELSRDELSGLMLANLEHARHVENERLSMNSIFTATAAGMLVFTIGTDNSLVGLASMSLLIIICILCMLLNKRWSDVFVGHSASAKNIAKILYGENSHLNDYYYFNHTPDVSNANKAKKWFLQIRTANIFRWYYYTILTFVFVLWCYFALMGIFNIF